MLIIGGTILLRKGDIEISKLVAWAIGIVLALVLIIFVWSTFAPGEEGSLVSQIIDALRVG